MINAGKNPYRSSHRNAWVFAIVASAVAILLVIVGVAYSTGHWSREATHVGNNGAGLHIPAPSATSNQPPATGAVGPR